MDDETRSWQVPLVDRGVLRHSAHPFGRSALGIELDCYGPQDGPVDLLLMAAVHGDESDTTVVLSDALRSVRPDALRNPAVLCMNPDGVLRGTRGNARGVDLNRNLPTANWSAAALRYRGHGQQEQAIELGTGSAPASEPETRALLDLVARLRPRAVVSLHAPLACVEDPSGSPLAAWIAAEAGLPLVPDVGYETPGSFGTWCASQGIAIVTWELPAEPLPALLASHVPVLQRLLTGRYPAGVRPVA
jgi:protein MpaA